MKYKILNFLSYCKVVYQPTSPENKTCTSDDECGSLDPTYGYPNGTYCGDTFWDDLFEHTQRGASDPLKDLLRCKPHEKPCVDPTGIYGCLDPTGVYCRPLSLKEYVKSDEYDLGSSRDYVTSKEFCCDFRDLKAVFLIKVPLFS